MELFSPETLGLIFLAVLTLTAYSHSPDSSESYNTTLIDVIDGDTIDITVNGRNETVRFLGVDTPETHAENTPQEFGLENNSINRACLRSYGEKAANFVERNLDNTIEIRTDSEADRRGSYGRLLGYIYSGNESVNSMLLEEGLARMYDSSFSKREEYRMLEKEAREEEIGVWSCG